MHAQERRVRKDNSRETMFNLDYTLNQTEKGKILNQVFSISEPTFYQNVKKEITDYYILSDSC